MRVQPICKQVLALAMLISGGLFGSSVIGQTSPLDPPRIWAVSIGGSNVDFISDAAPDGAGGVYVTGYTNSPNFPQTLTGAPGAGYDVFVAQIDSNGSTVWSTRYGGSGGDYGNAIAVDPNGNLLIAGRLGGHGPFVTDSIHKGTGDDILVLKLSGAGAFIHATRYGGTGADEAFGIASSPSGDIVAVGSTAGTTLPVTSSTYNGSSGDAFVLRLSGGGGREWAFRYGGSSFEKAQDVVVDANGYLYVAGETGSFDFQQTINTYQGSGGAKAFLARFDSTGLRDWAQRYGGSNVERAYCLSIPPSGGVLMAGYTTSSDFPTTISGMGSTGLDAFLSQFQANGTRMFSRRIGGSLDDLALDISTDASGNVFMVGETQSVNFPSTNNNFKGLVRDQFLAKFSPVGEYAWSLPMGGNQNDFSGGAVTSLGATVYLAGHTQSLNYPQNLPGSGGNTARGALARFRDCLGQYADFSFSHVCEFDTVHFVNLSTKGTSDSLAYMWWFGDGDSTEVFQPSHYYATPGAYLVTLRITSPCGVDSFITKTAHVYPGPVAGFGHGIACETRWTNFSDSTLLDTLLGSAIADWSWDFGNGGIDSIANPVVVYDSAAAYEVMLAIETNHGCRDTFVDTVQVHFTPFANFNFQDVCLRDTAFFDDMTLLAGDSLGTWDWDFGDGSSSNDQDPAYLYALPDTFQVVLVAGTNQSCSDTATAWIKVLPLPVVDFSMTEVCWPAAVEYVDSSSLTGDSISGYAWHFGDSLQSNVQDTLHAYAASGDYSVVLYVFTASGCVDSLLQPLTVHDKPEAAFGFENICFPNSTIFTDSAGVLADSLVAWNWDFGDGGFDSIPSPTHTYMQADTYWVSLSVESGFGCRDTAIQGVTVYPKPWANFHVEDVCVPLLAEYRDSSLVSGDTLVNFEWEFGDGGTGTGVQVTHAFVAGDYVSTLIVETSSGCRDTITDSLTVYPQPNAAFGLENVCDNDTVFFTDSSSVSSGAVALHWYDFGDGNGDTIANPNWVYGQFGIYTVTHIVETGLACRDTVIKEVRIHALPDPQPQLIGYADICQGDTVLLREFQSFVHYEWENGDTADRIWAAGYSDWVTLVVVDTNECVNIDSVELRFHNVPRPNAVITPGPIVLSCSNENLYLTAGNSYFSYAWSDGQTSDTILVTQDGEYAILVSNGFGCADTSDTVVVTIAQAPDRPTISQSGALLSVPDHASHQWYLNGLPIPLATGSSHTALSTGAYYVEVWNEAGCSVFSDTVSMTVGLQDDFEGLLSLYPNPFADHLELRARLKRGGTMNLQVLDMAGRVVVFISKRVSSGQFEANLLLPILPPGMYILELELNGSRQQFKLLH